MKIGLLGGGQLGRMLLQEALNWSLDFSVLDNDENAPCKYLCKRFVHGSFNDYETVLEFGKSVDIITIEIENVNTDALFELEKLGKKVYPQPNIIKLIQDKGLQKMFYNDYKIASSKFILTDSKQDVLDCKHALPFVQKLRKGGYDGKGVKVHTNSDSLQNAFDSPSVLEVKEEIDMEISVIVARSINGETVAYDAVECVFDPKLSLVEMLISPARISPTTNNKAKEIALTIIEKLNMVGVLAVEFFITTNGDLLVNEIAPRPHNSGHCTIEANVCSQFEQLLRCILTQPLGNVNHYMAATMVNILGAENYFGKAIYQGLNNLLKINNVFIHLYGKEITKPNRKMGHVTILDNDIESCLDKAKQVKKIFTVIS